MRFILSCCVLAVLSSSTVSFATTVVHNAVIHTVDDARPTANALAWSDDGRIIAVGTNEDVLSAHPDATRIDLAGRTVIPGLIDAHAHLMGLGLSLMRVDLVDTSSKQDVVERLETFAADLPDDAWLLGRGWDQNDWPDKDFPSRADLDEAFPERPVWLRRIDGHAAWANSAAMAAADRRFEGDWQPEGGRVVRDDTGQPTGIFIDRAMGLVESVVPETTPAEAEEALKRALRKAASLGLTGVHEAGTSLPLMRLYQQFIERDAMTLRVYAMANGVGEALDYLCENGPLGNDTGYLLARSVKFYADGALGSRGAALLASYSDDPGNAGLLIQPAEEMVAQVKRGVGCGLQVNVHAIGDRGNRVVLDAFEAAQKAHGDNPGRHRVEHAQVVALDDLERFSSLGLIASMQPTHATSDMYWAEDRVGHARIQGAYAWQKLIKLGVPMAFGSDFPVEKVDPMLGYHAAVTRQDAKGWPAGGWYPDERVSRAEALHGFTLGAAYAAFQEQQLGSLSVGKLADLVVLSDDLMSVPADQLLQIKVLATVVNGRTVYQSSERPMAD